MRHFVTLIKIRVHLIRVNPGHICEIFLGEQECSAFFFCLTAGQTFFQFSARTLKFS